MGYWILEPRSTQTVPGTCRLLEGSTHAQLLATEGFALKTRKDIILVPQPSEDPNDPLKWPLWQRDLILIILSSMAALSVSTASIIAGDVLLLSRYLHRSVTDIILLTGYLQLATGISCAIFVPSAKIWGKRHLFLLASVLLIVGSVWSGQSTTYRSLVGSRVCQGIAYAPFEALLGATVGDLYFIHERGSRQALANAFLYGGSFMTPVFAGWVTDAFGWRWSFNVLAIIAAIAFPFVLFLAPETAFERRSFASPSVPEQIHAIETDGYIQPRDALTAPDSDQCPSDEKTSSSTHISRGTETYNVPVNTKRLSYGRRLLPVQGRLTQESIIRLILRPFILLFHPAILWLILTAATSTLWVSFTLTCFSVEFAMPPLQFNSTQIGYTFIAAWIGVFLGFVSGACILSLVPRFMTTRNNSIYEPEFRLVLILPASIIGTIGLYGVGQTMSKISKYGWAPPCVFFMLQILAMNLSAVGGIAYIVDAYNDISVEALTIFVIARNMFAYAVSGYIYDWMEHFGILRTFQVLTGTQLALALLTIPLYIFGKRLRLAMSRTSHLT